MLPLTVGNNYWENTMSTAGSYGDLRRLLRVLGSTDLRSVVNNMDRGCRCIHSTLSLAGLKGVGDETIFPPPCCGLVSSLLNELPDDERLAPFRRIFCSDNSMQKKIP